MAEVIDLPGVMTYGANPDDAQCKVQALALRVLAELLVTGEEEHRLTSGQPYNLASGPGYGKV